VRETPAGRRVGGDRHRGPHQRHTAAAHLVPAVPPVSALLHPAPGPVQGQDSGVAGERVQARVAPQPGDTHQFQGLRQALKSIYNNIAGRPYAYFVLLLCVCVCV